METRHPSAHERGWCELCGEPDTGTPIQMSLDGDNWAHDACIRRENAEMGF